ncbi:N-acetylglucosamine kinase [Amycolatopsis sp. WAC 01375]|uniref:N-acetylglucosamine kinase n=1 Tax=unclassified Amycolatopsis TaxID=2618356 RepID=UPI000F77F955|nr:MULTISPECIES: BadF/BadG/BcrA/BcrD ATPase family protein [unclassified Amycolatopsis]RSM81837.1 N-acetylglucosamine kinase [Amycolatopsis sp. WAC 01375]RSN23675.1 N-acetylglucosamine kinase [Amycolatopsis sp. WAC 01416]
MTHVVGVDAGGTSTRAIAVDASGAVLGTGRAGGANPNSHPPSEAAARIASAIAGALGGLDPAATKACVVGMAGVSKLSDPAVAEIFEAAWKDLGISPVRTVPDPEVAYASATSAPDGSVLVAGTGSIAGRVRGRRMVSTAGGYGWLLGDEGSAYWLGREAVRSTLDVLSRGGGLGPLARSVLTEALGPSAVDPASDRAPLRHALITSANSEAPIRLARFAPFVSEADREGDPAADEITTRAAALLVTNVMAARDPGETTPIVLVGSVLSPEGPVGAKVRAELTGIEALTSTDGVLGAAWLAAVEAYGEDAPRPAPR